MENVISFDTAVLLSLVIPGLVVLCLWKRLWIGILCGMLAIIASWCVLNAINLVDVDRSVAEVHQPIETGEELSYDDQMYDGVGDRVAMLVLGWIPAGMSTVAGVALAYGIRRFHHRRNPMTQFVSD